MRTTSKKLSAKRRKPPQDKRTKPAAAQPVIPRADRDAYVQTLVETGQAAPLQKDGTLPPGATHKLERGADGQVIVTRRRFSIG